MIESAHTEPLSLRSAGEIRMAEECKGILYRPVFRGIRLT